MQTQSTSTPKSKVKAITTTHKPSKNASGEAIEVQTLAVVPEGGEIIAVPFSKLALSPLKNARIKLSDDAKVKGRQKKGGELEGIEALAALILSQGLLQNLIGFRQKRNGKTTDIYEVSGGGRRYRALALLLSRGQIRADFPVPIKVVTEEEAIEKSLAENTHREPMHLADEFAAMRNMIEHHGKTIEGVANAFGMTALRVKRRLALANVSPRLFELFRNDEIGFEEMTALAITINHAEQEHAWDSLSPHHRNAHALRHALLKQDVSLKNDPVAKFVGAKAFEQAGGTVRRDLFSDDNEGYLQDPILLERLAIEKIAAATKDLAGEGWKWVDIKPRADYQYIHSFLHASTIQRAPTLEEEKRFAALEVEHQAIDAGFDALDSESDDAVGAQDVLIARNDAYEAALEALQESLHSPDPEELAIVGAVVCIDRTGKILIHRGLIRPEDKRAASATGIDATNDDEPTAKTKPTHSDRLTRQLTSHRTAAMRATLSAQPNIALVVVTHRLVKSVFSSDYYAQDSVCKLSMEGTDLLRDAPDMKASRAWTELQAAHSHWKGRLPRDGKQTLFAWLLDQSLEELLSLLSFCIASGVDATQTREGPNESADELATALRLDMADWWIPTAESYFSHVSKGRIADVVAQAVSGEAAAPLDKMKKGAAADAAERLIAKAGWLPDMMRTV